MSKNVNPDLYDFLKESETGTYEKNDETIVFVRVPFWKLEDFVKIVGEYYFSESGADVRMFGNDIVIELNDIFAGLNQGYEDYKNCLEYTTVELEYEICIECEKSYIHNGKRFPRPKKYENINLKEYFLCDECYWNLEILEV